MLPCYLCPEVFETLGHFFSHIKDFHKRKGKNEFKCPFASCQSNSTQFSAYEKHVINCYKSEAIKFGNAPEMNDNLHGGFTYDVATTSFQKLMHKKAVQLGCELSAKMNFPRNATYEIAALVKDYVSALIGGVRTIITPLIEPANHITVEQFIQAVEWSIDDIRSESVFDSILTKADLITPLDRCELDLMELEKSSEEDTENSEQEGDEEQEDDQEQQEDEAVFSNVPISEYNLPKREKVTLMPIRFQIKKFLELPNVFEKIRINTLKLANEGKLNHFINAKLWKEKLEAYEENQTVIPIFFYSDAAQLNNALGCRCKAGKEVFGYYSFPTMPSEYMSRLENIFVASLHAEQLNNTHGNERIYNNLIDELNDIAREGIVLDIDGTETPAFFVLGLILGDNLEMNSIIDFAKSFRANFYCRICKLKRDEMEKQTIEVKEALRNRQNYEDDVMMNDLSKTGVSKYSIFNEVELFHVVESCSVDLTHDLDEGISHYNLSEILLYFIKTKKYFSLETLNYRMRTLQYGEIEKGNVGLKITMKNLKKKKFKMIASEMNCFATHLRFMIGEFVPTDDPSWQFYLKTMRFIDLCYLPGYTEEEIGRLENTTHNMIQDYKKLYKKKSKPKHHLSTHYPGLIRKFGPLRYLRTIRYEAKHKVMKNYAKNTNSRRDLSYSIGRKLQYDFALRLIEKKGLDDKITVAKYELIRLKNEDFENNIRPSVHFNRLLQEECFVTEKVIINGIVFSTKLYLPYVQQPNQILYEVYKILLLSLNDISSVFFVCKQYNKVVADAHFGCYSVDKESIDQDMLIISANEFLSEHTYPVQLHSVIDKYLFTCKRF